jgi:hypothetical protein
VLIFPRNLSISSKESDIIGGLCVYINVFFNNEQSCILPHIS